MINVTLYREVSIYGVKFDESWDIEIDPETEDIDSTVEMNFSGFNTPIGGVIEISPKEDDIPPEILHKLHEALSVDI